MKNQDQDRTVVLVGIEHGILFASGVNDEQRIGLNLPARGTLCSWKECVCENDADSGSVAHPICGCWLADCPYVHGESDTDRRHGRGAIYPLL